MANLGGTGENIKQRGRGPLELPLQKAGVALGFQALLMPGRDV